MARRVRVAVVALALAAATCGARAAGDPAADSFVRYSFDDDDVETGPDTFAIFEHARGSVDLSSDYRFSGYHSVEIRDVAGDGDFPELQGYLPLRRSGTLYAHFALMTTDAAETLNVALGGPAGFRLGRDGIAFWLRTRDGMLEHLSDSIPKKLFAVEPFTWYRIDLAYDIEAGSYDLSISEEQSLAQIVWLPEQPNAASQPGSAVDKFSFIGDAGEDTSNVVYYVDDVVIGPDRAVQQIPYAAPGRRKLFFDRFLDARAKRSKSPCLPGASPADFGLDARATRRVRSSPLGPALDAWLAGKTPRPAASASDAAADFDPATQRRLMALRLWAEGCRATGAGDSVDALAQFERAAALVGEARMPVLSQALALASLERFSEADRLWEEVEAAWRSDPRYPIAMARLGLARGDSREAESWLRGRAEDVVDALATSTATERRIAAQYFYTLLWLDQASSAERLAERAVAGLSEVDPSGPLPLASQWVERIGDAQLLQGDHERARASYEQALAKAPASSRLLLKLSDVHYLRGDDDGERIYRERIYGSLFGRADDLPEETR